MTLFDDAMARLSASADRVFGEAEGFVYRPYKRADDVNARNAVDNSRAVETFTGIFTQGFARAGGGHDRQPWLEAERPGYSTVTPTLDFALAELPYAPQVGDRIARLATAAVYEVAEIRHDPSGIRAVLDLNVISA